VARVNDPRYVCRRAFPVARVNDPRYASHLHRLFVKHFRRTPANYRRAPTRGWLRAKP
jgi:hypothetical protein